MFLVYCSKSYFTVLSKYTKIIFSREKAIKTWYSLLNKYHISSCPGRNAVCCPQNHKSGHAQWPSTAI